VSVSPGKGTSAGSFVPAARLSCWLVVPAHDIDEAEHPIVEEVSAIDADDEISAGLEKPVRHQLTVRCRPGGNRASAGDCRPPADINRPGSDQRGRLAVGAIGAGTGNLEMRRFGSVRSRSRATLEILLASSSIKSDSLSFEVVIKPLARPVPPLKDVHEPRCKGRSSIVIVVARGNSVQ